MDATIRRMFFGLFIATASCSPMAMTADDVAATGDGAVSVDSVTHIGDQTEVANPTDGAIADAVPDDGRDPDASTSDTAPSLDATPNDALVQDAPTAPMDATLVGDVVADVNATLDAPPTDTVTPRDAIAPFDAPPDVRLDAGFDAVAIDAIAIDAARDATRETSLPPADVSDVPATVMTRCVAGVPASYERLTSFGWVRSTCGNFQLCSRGSCRQVCDVTATPTHPSICFVPNADGVNDGVLYYTSNTSLLLPPAQVNAAAFQGSTAARIYPTGDASAWPYAWSLAFPNGIASISFRLNQFGLTRRQVTMTYRGRRSGVIAGTTRFSLAAENPRVLFAYEVRNALTTWSRGLKVIPTTSSTWFDMVGGINSMHLGSTGDGAGGAVDLIDANYIMLTVGP